MIDSPRTDAAARRRWITFGETIALAALAVSAFGAWIAWKSSNDDKPTRVVEQRQPIPLTLRATVDDDGKAIIIAPVEASHALESLNIVIKGSSPLETDGSGRLDAKAAAEKLDRSDDESVHSVSVRIMARYVEMGQQRTTTGNYVLRYRWEGGGLLGGRSLQLVGLSRG